MIIETRNILLLASLCLQAACSTPMKKEVASAHIVKHARIEEKNIREILRTEFSVTSKTSNRGAWGEGFLTVTDTEIFIYMENPATGHLEQDLRLTYSGMRGLDLVKSGAQSQIQILGVTGILALEPQWPDCNSNNQQATRNLYRYIKSKEVPDFVAKRIIKRPITIPLIIPLPNSMFF